MAKIPWVFKNDTTSAVFTTSVLSANYMYLRQSYKDYFAGSALTITIKNQANEAAGFTLNDRVDLYYLDGVGTKIWSQIYWVDEIQYTDYPGNVGLSTATITCIDWLARAARVFGGGLVIGQTSTCQQLARLDNFAGGPLPPDMVVDTDTGESLAYTTTVTESCVNFIQELQITENGAIVMFENTLRLNPRSAMPMATHAEFGRTPSASVLGYQTFDRIRAGQSMINNVENNYSGGTLSFTNNPSSNVYGTYSENITTRNVSYTPAYTLARMRAIYQGDPTIQRYIFSFDDLSNNSALLATWLEFYKSQGAFTYYMNYLVPGDAVETTELIRLEGVNIDLTPERTTFTVYASPFAYYDMFVLGTPMGVLGRDYLGW